MGIRPRRPDDPRIFLKAEISPDGLLEISQGEKSVQLSPLQYTLDFACKGEETADVVAVLMSAGAEVDRNAKVFSKNKPEIEALLKKTRKKRR